MNTSAQAYDKVKPVVPSIRQRVLDAVLAAGPSGITRDELIAVTNIHQNSLSGRITELKRDGLIAEAEWGTRPNSRGNPEQIYIQGDGVKRGKRKVNDNKEIVINRDRLVEILKAHRRAVDTGTGIGNMFVWEDQPEGYYFWYSISDELGF